MIIEDQIKVALPGKEGKMSMLGEIYVLTHDSIGVGEDGPTHQPIETIPYLRARPEKLVFRPGESDETSGAYKLAIQNRNRPAPYASADKARPKKPTPQSTKLPSVATYSKTERVIPI